jgi:N6-adenosine-specific RNA methylase IME4
MSLLFPDTGLKFKCIAADPAWPEHGGGKSKRGADKHYPLMTVQDIARLPVRPVAADDAHLWLWVTDTYLMDGSGFAVAKAWGFRPVADFPWVKMVDGRLQKGLGQYSRKAHEHLLLCVRGDAMVPEPADRPDSVLIAPRREHSAKPECAYKDVIERVSVGPRLELFARTPRPNWTVLGNEVNGGVLLQDSLRMLAEGRKF